MTKATNRFSAEMRERAVRMVLEHQNEHASQWATMGSIAAKIGCTAETLRGWVRQAERDLGVRAGPTSEEREQIKAPEREVRELRQANEILRKASAYFAQAELDRSNDEGVNREYWNVYGVEPICKVLVPAKAGIAPSTYREHAARRADPGKAPARERRDAGLRDDIRRVYETNFEVYCVRKIWRQLRREGIDVPRCPVSRLMRQMGLKAAVRGRALRTTISNPAAACPLDRVNRQFKAPCPNALWVSDFTYVATWAGFVDVAFVIDVFARRIVGWRASPSARTDFVLDALEQALRDRRPVRKGGLVHQSDRGVQYVSIRYTARFADADIEPSVARSAIPTTMPSPRRSTAFTRQR